MPLSRFRLQTLMIAVGIAGVMLGGLEIVRRLERARIQRTARLRENHRQWVHHWLMQQKCAAVPPDSPPSK